MSETRCPDCGGDQNKHPWPEDGRYVSGCVKELRAQIETLMGLVEGMFTVTHIGTTRELTAEQIQALVRKLESVDE